MCGITCHCGVGDPMQAVFSITCRRMVGLAKSVIPKLISKGSGGVDGHSGLVMLGLIEKRAGFVFPCSALKSIRVKVSVMLSCCVMNVT